MRFSRRVSTGVWGASGFYVVLLMLISTGFIRRFGRVRTNGADARIASSKDIIGIQTAIHECAQASVAHISISRLISCGYLPPHISQITTSSLASKCRTVPSFLQSVSSRQERKPSGRKEINTSEHQVHNNVIPVSGYTENPQIPWQRSDLRNPDHLCP